MGSPSTDVGQNQGAEGVYGPAMRFRILGPLEVDAGDGPLGAGGPKQRAVLAHLVIRANQVVPAATLIDELWGEEPPETAKNTLQTYISHLRKVVGAERLQARAPGYLLAIRSEELDLTRFDALMEEARVARPTDGRVAFAALDDALSLWRGPALADVVDDSSLRAEAARLDELRVAAEEDRLALLLELGEPGRAVGELEALLARNPLREGCWGMLMLALYRSGRQADALAAYGRARSILAEELGIDPSPELVRLHDRILKQAPSLDLRGEPLRGYRLLERIGQGRLGVVFRGVQPNVGRDVAIKVLHQEVASDASFIRRFEPEAQAVAGLEHPHIVPVYDYWREPEGAYIVSRFLPGGSLAGLEARGESLDLATAARVVAQVRSALDFAHRRGVTHGDLSPTNILMDADGNAYLADFRVAVGEPADPAADVRALDAIAERLLPGSGGRGPGPDADVGSMERVELRNPYKGLRAFGEPDARDFFGRRALIAKILGRFAEPRGVSRFLAVVGPSGSGKSSVVRAGVLPAVRAGALEGSEGWFVAEMVPGAHPIEELEAALLRIAARPVPGLLDQLEARPRGLLEAIDAVVPGDVQVLLVVDQLEEAFTLAAAAAERELFLESLRVATADPASRLRVIVTLRADFYDRPLLYPRFGDLLGDRTEVVPPLTPDELELAITGPARGVGVTAEPGLAAELIADVAHQVGALPLLQYALTELFERRDGERLTLEAYRDIGGVAGALSARADRLYGAADQTGRAATKQVFLRLVTLGEGRPDTRRRVTLAALDAIGVDAAAVDSVLSTFGRHRLLTFDREPSTREPTVEIAHEALLTAWARLRGWIDEAREDLRQEQRLMRAAAEWRASGEDPSFLLQGARLEQLAVWIGSTTLAVGASEREYLRASLERRREEEEAASARRDEAARLERRSVNRLRGLVAVLTAAALVASLLTVVAVRQRGRALEAGRVADVRELAAAAMANLDVDPQRSMLLALEAVRASGDHGVLQEAAQALHSAVAADREVLTLRDPSSANVAYSPDGALLATGGSAGGTDQPDVVIWDATSGARLRRLHASLGDVNFVAFAPDSTRLVTSAADGMIVWNALTGDQELRLRDQALQGGFGRFSPDGSELAVSVPAYGSGLASLRLLDASTGRPVRPPLQFRGSVCQAPAFSPDGRWVAASTFDGGTPVWDVRSGRPIAHLPVSGCSVVFSPDSTKLAIAAYGGASVWNVDHRREMLALQGQRDLIGADWSPDGTRLATGGLDGTARIWDATTGEQLLVLPGIAGLVANVAFSPDGTRLLAGGGDGTARVWDVTPTATSEGLGRGASPWGLDTVAFSPDGTRLAVTGPWLREDGSPPVFGVVADAATGREIVTLRGALLDAAFSPDGERLAVAGSGAHGTFVRVVDAASGRTLRSFPAGGEFVAFSPDGRSIATQDGSGGVSLWNARPDAASERYAAVRYPGSVSDPVGRMAFSPDGRLVAGVSGQAVVRVWDAATGEELLRFQGQTGQGHGLAFSPDGHLLAVSGGGGVTFWRMPSGRPVTTLSTTAEIQAVAFSSDGRLLATGGYDGAVRVWDVASGQETLTLPGHVGIVNDVAFSPDGTTIVSVGQDGTLRTDVLPIRELVRIARGRLTRGFTTAECQRYLHVPTCP